MGLVFRSIRDTLEMPGLKPSSIRDYVATMLRHAHVDFQVRYIHKDEQETWQGHRKDDVHGRYGKYRPDYMVRSLVATEAMLRDLDLRSGGGLFRQGPDKAELNSLSEQEDVEKSREVRVSDRTELPRETTVYLGPRQDKTGEFGPLQADFRQVSDNKIRHPDGTIDALGTFGRVPLEKRLAANGIKIFETAHHDPIKSDPDTYLVATGSSQIPAVRAGKLKSDPISKKKSNRNFNKYHISKDTGQEYIDALRRFEIEMTEMYNACRDDESFQDFEIKFERDILSVIGPVVTGMPSYKPPLDFDNMTEAEIEAYVESRLKVA